MSKLFCINYVNMLINTQGYISFENNIIYKDILNLYEFGVRTK